MWSNMLIMSSLMSNEMGWMALVFVSNQEKEREEGTYVWVGDQIWGLGCFKYFEQRLPGVARFNFHLSCKRITRGCFGSDQKGNKRRSDVY